MAEYLPKFGDDSFTLTASGAVTGGTILDASGATAAAGSTTSVGIAGHDAADGQPVVVFHGEVQRPIASGAITKNTLVKVATGGKVSTYTSGTDSPDARVGVALATVVDGALVPVLFER